MSGLFLSHWYSFPVTIPIKLNYERQRLREFNINYNYKLLGRNELLRRLNKLLRKRKKNKVFGKLL